jgi:peptidoglycan/xylan/chitin deacetylase (PgdA/CDA1 family)
MVLFAVPTLATRAPGSGPTSAGWQGTTERSRVAFAPSPGPATSAASPSPEAPVSPSPSESPALEAEIVRSGPRSSGAVALTFDDGYDRRRCGIITNALRRSGATGTFFINGIYLKQAPDAWRDTLDGQEVANHTRSHRDLTKETDEIVRKQIAYNEALQEHILGRPMLKVLRPPYGAQDARVRAIAAQLGYHTLLLWSVDTLDWRRSATVRSIVRRAVGAPPGSVILMHCGPPRTAKALPHIIRDYHERGIRLAGLQEVLQLPPEGAIDMPLPTAAGSPEAGASPPPSSMPGPPTEGSTGEGAGSSAEPAG